MNRFEALGLAVQASLGERITVLVARAQDVTPMVEAILTRAKEVTGDVKVSCAKGSETIWIRDGEIRFLLRTSVRARGPRPDFILVDDARTLTDREIDAVRQLGHGLSEVVCR